MSLRMDFRMRIVLGKHVAERKVMVVQVPMIVELTLIVIKRRIQALRICAQNTGHPLLSKHESVVIRWENSARSVG